MILPQLFTQMFGNNNAKREDDNLVLGCFKCPAELACVGVSMICLCVNVMKDAKH